MLLLKNIRKDNMDWKRYHALLDISMQRKYTDAEQAEYEAYLPILAKLDAEEAARCKPATDRLMRRHAETLASLEVFIKEAAKKSKENPK